MLRSSVLWAARTNSCGVISSPSVLTWGPCPCRLGPDKGTVTFTFVHSALMPSFLISACPSPCILGKPAYEWIRTIEPNAVAAGDWTAPLHEDQGPVAQPPRAMPYLRQVVRQAAPAQTSRTSWRWRRPSARPPRRVASASRQRLGFPVRRGDAEGAQGAMPGVAEAPPASGANICRSGRRGRGRAQRARRDRARYQRGQCQQCSQTARAERDDSEGADVTQAAR